MSTEQEPDAAHIADIEQAARQGLAAEIDEIPGDIDLLRENVRAIMFAHDVATAASNAAAEKLNDNEFMLALSSATREYREHVAPALKEVTMFLEDALLKYGPGFRDEITALNKRISAADEMSESQSHNGSPGNASADTSTSPDTAADTASDPSSPDAPGGDSDAEGSSD